MNKLFIATAVLITGLASCNLSKKSVDTAAEVEFTCDDKITFTSTVKGIFDARCTSCDSGSKPA